MALLPLPHAPDGPGVHLPEERGPVSVRFCFLFSPFHWVSFLFSFSVSFLSFGVSFFLSRPSCSHSSLLSCPSFFLHFSFSPFLLPSSVSVLRPPFLFFVPFLFFFRSSLLFFDSSSSFPPLFFSPAHLSSLLYSSSSFLPSFLSFPERTPSGRTPVWPSTETAPPSAGK